MFAGHGKPTLRSWFNTKIRAKADLSKFNRRLDGNSSPPENPTAESSSLFLHVPAPRTFYGRSPCKSVVSIPVMDCLDVKTHRHHQSFLIVAIGHGLRVAPPTIAESGRQRGCCKKTLPRVRFPKSLIFWTRKCFRQCPLYQCRRIQV